jgi:hypothetical protein
MGWVVDARPQEKDPEPTVKEAGLSPVPIWTVAENLAPTKIRTKFCSGRDENTFLCVPLVLSGESRRRGHKAFVFSLLAQH